MFNEILNKCLVNFIKANDEKNSGVARLNLTLPKLLT